MIADGLAMQVVTTSVATVLTEFIEIIWFKHQGVTFVEN